MDDLRDRVDAVERALTDGEGDLTALAEGAAEAARVEELETDVGKLREAVAELQAATQALRGYVGNVRSVNESVEQRADAALASVETLESRVDELVDERASTSAGPSLERPATESNGAAVSARAATQNDGHDRSEPERRDVCDACGRGDSGVQPAADGGSRNQSTPNGPGAECAGADECRPGATPAPAIGANRRTVGDFDAADESHRVRIEPSGRKASADNPDERSRNAVERGSDATPGLLARVRELL